MLVSFSINHKLYNNLGIQKNQIDRKYINTSNTNDCVSFGSDPATTLIYLIAKFGLIEALKNGPKNYNLNKILREIEKIVKTPSTYNNETLAHTLGALSKMPMNETESMHYRLMSSALVNSPALLSILKPNAFKIVPLVSDSNNINIQYKKDFLSNMILEGYPLSGENHLRLHDDITLAKAFESLDDKHYKSFKQEIVNIALYSEKYASAERKYLKDGLCFFSSPDTAGFRQRLILIETLNPLEHSDFLNKIQPDVVALKRAILSHLASPSPHSDYNFKLAESFISTENKFRHPSGQGVKYDKLAEVLWKETVKACNFEPEKISKALSMEESTVKWMLESWHV